MKLLKLITLRYMKIFKIPLLAFLFIIISSCELEEVAPFLDRQYMRIHRQLRQALKESTQDLQLIMLRREVFSS